MPLSLSSLSGNIYPARGQTDWPPRPPDWLPDAAPGIKSDGWRRFQTDHSNCEAKHGVCWGFAKILNILCYSMSDEDRQSGSTISSQCYAELARQLSANVLIEIKKSIVGYWTSRGVNGRRRMQWHLKYPLRRLQEEIGDKCEFLWSFFDAVRRSSCRELKRRIIPKIKLRGRGTGRSNPHLVNSD